MVTTRRVGTLTLGVTLIIMGGSFLLHYIVPAVTYDMVFKIWPFIFILLGLEVLISTFKVPKDCKLIYDKAGIFLTCALILFAMVAGFIAMTFEYTGRLYI